MKTTGRGGQGGRRGASGRGAGGSGKAGAGKGPAKGGGKGTGLKAGPAKHAGGGRADQPETRRGAAAGAERARSARTGAPAPRQTVGRARPAPGRDDAASRPARAPREAAVDAAEAAVAPPATTGVQTVTVTPDEAGMRVDRFLEARFPGLSFSHIQRIVRKGELRVNGRRVETKDRLEAGQAVRIPPLALDKPKEGPRASKADDETRAFLQSLVLFEDADVMVLNKPFGLAVQGGSGTKRHVDGMLASMTDAKGQKPRLVHRLDKDTAGCLVVAKTRFAASALAKSFRSRDTKKVYWALVAGVPRVKQGRVSTYLAKGEDEEGDAKMQIARHGDEGASHAVTYYAVVETAAQKLAWLSLRPVTGRTHQLRAHTAHIGHPIVGDPKYFDIENWELPGGVQNRLHLLARRIVVPHPRTGKAIDVTAPLPPHMQQSWNLLGFDAKRYDPIEEAPSE